MKKVLIVLCCLIMTTYFQKTVAQSFEKKKIIWLTYLENNILSESDKLKLLLLNSLYSQNPKFSAEKISGDLEQIVNHVIEESKKRQLSVFATLDYIRPTEELQNNLLKSHLSLILLNEWNLQNELLYKSASVKFSNYILNEDEFAKFLFQSDSVYLKTWNLYKSNVQYRTLLPEIIKLKIWPDFNLQSSTYDTLGFDQNVKMYLDDISEDGIPKISRDSITKLTSQHIESYNENFVVDKPIETYNSDIHGSWDQFIYKRKVQREKDEKLIKNLKQGSKVLEKLVAYYDPQMAGRILKVLENSSDIYEAWSKLQYELPGIADDDLKTLIAYGTFGGSIVGASINIYNAFSKANSISSDQRIVRQLQIIGNKIDTLSKQMHERFDFIDKNLSLIYDNMSSQFRSMNLQLQNITYVTEQTRNDLYNLKKQINRVEADILNYLQASTEIKLKENLTYFLDYKRNFLNAQIQKDDFKKGIQQFANWGISISKEKLFAGSVSDYDYSDSEILRGIKKFSQADVFDLNYFILFTSQKFGKKYFETAVRKSNQNMWNLGAEAFLQFGNDWKDLYTSEISPNLVEQLIGVGEELKLNYSSILKNGQNVDTSLFKKMILFHKSKVSKLQDSYNFYQKIYLTKNDLDKDDNFSIWKLNPLKTYKINWPEQTLYDSTITHIKTSYSPDVLKVANSSVMTKLNLPLSYPASYTVDSSSIFKYGLILGNEIDLKYNYWEYMISPNYEHQGIDIAPSNDLIFCPGFTRGISGFMVVEGSINKEIIYRRSRFLPGIYYKGNDKYSGLALAARGTMINPSSANGYFPYSALKTSYSSLFDVIWNGEPAFARKLFLDKDSVKGISKYNPIPSLETLKVQIMDTLLTHQIRSYQLILDNEADLGIQYNSLDGAKRLYEAFYNLGMPNVAEFDSLKSFLYGSNMLIDAKKFREILLAFQTLNYKVGKIKSEITTTSNIDSVIVLIKHLYKENDLVMQHFDMKISKTQNNFFILWEENIFKNEYKKIDLFHSYSIRLFEKIDSGEIKVRYPKIDPLLSKLYLLKSVYNSK